MPFQKYGVRNIGANTFVDYVIFKSKYKLSSSATSKIEILTCAPIQNFEILGSYPARIRNDEAVKNTLPIKCAGQACFANLPEQIQLVEKHGYNRLTFSLPHPIKKFVDKTSYTFEEVKLYLTLAKKNKCLPAYVNIQRAIENSSITLDLATPKRSLYLYLTIFRTLAHDPGIVSAVVNLVTKAKVEFFRALFISHSLICNNSNHSFFPAGSFAYPRLEELTPDVALPNVIPDTLKTLVFEDKLDSGDSTGRFGVDNFIRNHIVETKGRGDGKHNTLQYFLSLSETKTLKDCIKPKILKKLLEKNNAA